MKTVLTLATIFTILHTAKPVMAMQQRTVNQVNCDLTQSDRNQFPTQEAYVEAALKSVENAPSAKDMIPELEGYSSEELNAIRAEIRENIQQAQLWERSAENDLSISCYKEMHRLLGRSTAAMVIVTERSIKASEEFLKSLDQGDSN